MLISTFYPIYDSSSSKLLQFRSISQHDGKNDLVGKKAILAVKKPDVVNASWNFKLCENHGYGTYR